MILEGLIVVAAVAIGAGMQRLSGMGLGLIGGPVLALVLGPVEGIVVINILACINAGLTTWTVRKNIDWSKFRRIAPALILGAIPGAVVVRVLDASVIQILLGVLLILALSLSTLVALPSVAERRVGIDPTAKLPALVAGGLGGFGNTLAGVAGPVITVYAQSARWPQQIYAATLQPIFMVAGFISFSVKLATGSVQVTMAGWIWPAALVAMVVGITVGGYLVSRVPRQAAWRLALVLAAAGAVTLIIRGVTQ